MIPPLPNHPLFASMEPQLMEQDVQESLLPDPQQEEPDPEFQNRALAQAILQNQAEINARSQQSQDQVSQQNRQRTKFYQR